jgi:UDP-N-acetylglucosamine 2-epimerase (non-hydrolysing)
MKITPVVCTRPNFMKVAPIDLAFKKFIIEHTKLNIEHLICHNGQHYNTKMSKIFLMI